MSDVPDFPEEKIPSEDEIPAVWDREHAGKGYYIWSRTADQSEFDQEIPDDLLLMQVELQYLNDEWNATLSKPNPRRGFLDVVTPQCLTTDSFEEARNHAETLLNSEHGRYDK